MTYRCKRCHRVLTDLESIEVGYGNTCYKKEFGRILKVKKKFRELSIGKHDINACFKQSYNESWKQISLLQNEGEDNGNDSH